MLAPSKFLAPTPPVINVFSPLSAGFDQITWGNTPASAAWPTIRRVFYVPFRLQRAATIVQMFCLNGGTASGNLDLGIYTQSVGLPSSRIVNSGSTGQTGTNAIQTVDITDTLLAPGDYYMAMAMDNTTGTTFRSTFAITQFMRAASIYTEQPGSFGLPSTASPAVPGVGYLPTFGVATVTLL